MQTINVMIKSVPLPVSVQKKEQEEAQALYQKILEAMTSSSPAVIELRCDKEEGKVVAVCSSEISAVILSENSGSTTTGKSAGFFAAVGGE